MKKHFNFGLIGLAMAALSAPVVAAPAAPYDFYSITPCRIIDTRGPMGATGGPILQGHAQRDFPIDVSPAACGIPSTAQAAVVNIVAVGPTGGGHLTIWPFGTSMPTAAALNFDAGEPAIANGAIIPLAPNPTNNISVYLGSGVGTTSHLVIDVTGYMQ